LYGYCNYYGCMYTYVMGKYTRNSVLKVRAKQAFPVVGVHIDRLAITSSMELFNAPSLI